MVVDQKYSDAIGLQADWPVHQDSADELDASGYCRWAVSYFVASEILSLIEAPPSDLLFRAGPISHSLGLAAELTFKGFLRGCGQSSAQVRRLQHNTYEGYVAATKSFDEVKFLNLVFENTKNLDLPDEIRDRLVADGEPDPERRWRNFFDHLRIVDDLYDRPYRSRYLTPGPVVLAEPRIVLVGLKILICAMQERLGHDYFSNSV